MTSIFERKDGNYYLNEWVNGKSKLTYLGAKPPFPKSRGWTQQQIADEVKVTQQTISYWFRYFCNGVGKDICKRPINTNNSRYGHTNINHPIRLFPCLYEDVRIPGESIEETTKRLNRERPTGISSQWELSKETFKDGSPNPHTCVRDADCKHYLFNC